MIYNLRFIFYYYCQALALIKDIFGRKPANWNLFACLYAKERLSNGKKQVSSSLIYAWNTV